MPLIIKRHHSVNIYLTSTCRHGCAFCFDGGKQSAVAIDKPGFSRILEKIRPECDKVSFIGGEPLSHPDFLFFLNRALDLGFSVNIFSAAGRLSEEVFQAMLFAPMNRIMVVLNATARLFKEWDVWSPLNHIVQCGVTLERDTAPLYTAADCVERWRLRRRIRVGIAQPMANGQNQWVPTEHLNAFGGKISEAAAELGRRGIYLGLDCGFTRCMFSDEEMEELERSNADYCFACEPIPDIGPEKEIWYCLPLRSYGVGDLEQYDSIQEMKDALRERALGDSPRFLYENCPECDHFQKICDGGCRGRIINDARRLTCSGR